MKKGLRRFLFLDTNLKLCRLRNIDLTKKGLRLGGSTFQDNPSTNVRNIDLMKKGLKRSIIWSYADNCKLAEEGSKSDRNGGNHGINRDH